MRHNINEGDYTEWLLNQRDYEHELWNTDPEVREFDRQQRAYEQKIRKNKRRSKPTSFRTVRLKECDKYAIADNGYIFVQWGGKCNILTPQKDVIYDTWFDSIQFFEDYTPTSPIEVRHNNKWNFLIPEENRILSDVWFGKVWPFEGGWAEVFIKPNDKEYLWLNMDGEIFHDDGTPYQPTEPKPINNNNLTNESKNMNEKNIIKLTETNLKKIIAESINGILGEAYGQYEQPSYLSQSSIDDTVTNIENTVQRDKVFANNMKYFAKAYRTVAAEYSIISSLKRNTKVGEIAKDILNVKSFLKYITKEYGDDLYTSSFDGYDDGEEMADMFLQHCVITLRKPDFNVKDLYENLGLRVPFRYRN